MNKINQAEIGKSRVSWTELLEILTESERKKSIKVIRHSNFERIVMPLLERDGWSARLSAEGEKDYSFGLFRNGTKIAVQAKNLKTRVNLAQIETFLEFLSRPSSQKFKHGVFISASGFSQSVYSFLRAEKITNISLGVLRDNEILWDDEEFSASRRSEKKQIYIGVFTCKGGVGKTTVSAHLAGAFALNGYDVALVDLDHQSNLRKLLGEGVYLPNTNGEIGSKIRVYNQVEFSTKTDEDSQIIICDCNPEFEVNPLSFIRKFDYCLIPTTLNPLGVNKNADVIKRTFKAIRSENIRANLFAFINSYHSDEPNRNNILNELLKAEFQELTEKDSRCHYIDPNEAAIRFSKQLLYWGYHIIEEGKPQLAFRAIGGHSHPRTDFLKLVDYLEANTNIQKFSAKLAA